MGTTMPVGSVVERGGGASGDRLTRRRLTNRLLWWACGAALLAVLAPVVSIVGGVAVHGLAHWRWSALTTQTVGNGGGLSNAIVGTLLIVACVLVVAGILGVAGGVYIAEYCGERRASLLRGASEVLSGVPSIVLGYVGYTVLVVALHWGFSLAAAVVVLSLLVMPYVVKTTEGALRQVPTAYREGGEALGMHRAATLRRLVLRPALPGVATGLIVGLAIALGETAPLLYTAGWSAQLPTAHLTHAPVGYLPYAVYEFFQQPSPSLQQLSHLAAFLLVVLVVMLIAASRLVVAMTQRHAPERTHRTGRSGRR